MSRLPRPSLAVLTIAVAALCGLCGVAYLVYGVTARPYTEIEAQIVFQVDRLQHHLPLYTDPAVGAWEAGAPPSRFHVLYPPLFVELLALFPTHSLVATRTIARVISVGLFLFSLVNIVRSARPENRPAVLAGALLTVGLDMLIRGAGLAATDIPAIALSIAGLVRANKKGEVDPLAAGMLALAPFVKHAVLGVSAGVFLAHLVTTRKRGARVIAPPLVVAAVTAVVLAAHYHWISDGVWLRHITRATGQALSFDRWVNEFGHRILILGLPHAVLLVVAIRRRAPLLAVLPFALAMGWTILTLAKHGSTTHYWIEPTLAGLVLLGVLPAGPAPSRVLPALGLVLAIAIAVPSPRELARAPAQYAEWEPLMTKVRTACALAPGQIAMASDVRLELELDGRVIVPAWESSQMARAGKLSLAQWREDLLRPEVACLVTEAQFFELQPSKATRLDIVTVYRRELRPDVEAAFEPAGYAGPFLVWRRRSPSKI